MNHNTILKYAVMHAAGAAVYIALLVTFISLFAERMESEAGILLPMMMLLLFVTSAAVMAMLVFARPVMWYLDGQKKEALSLAISTIGCMIVLAAIVFFVILLVI